MLPTTSLRDAWRYPVTTSVAGAVIGVTGYWWSGATIDGFFMDGHVWDRWQFWRALTSTLPHANLLHLAFNLYWWWRFGTLLERRYGHVQFAGIAVLLAMISSLFEFALAAGGVGLSGVGYGLWAMLWVLELRDSKLAGIVDQRTNLLFVAWFFLCVVMTSVDFAPIGNIAHASGAAAGVLLGLAIGSRGATQRACIAGLVGMLLLGVVGSTVLWPWVNCSGQAAAGIEYVGYEALEQGRNAKAIRALEIAAHTKGAPARTWYNLGIAYQRDKRYDDALQAYETAAVLPDASDQVRKTAQEFRDYLRHYRSRL